jgi:hypothetical protein
MSAFDGLGPQATSFVGVVLAGDGSLRGAAFLVGYQGEADGMGLNASQDSSGAAAVDTPPSVEELPPAPGSACLFISGMLSIGAWQLVRKAGSPRLGNLPDWYHPHGPYQIGHSLALDPTLDSGLLAVRLFDEPIVVVSTRLSSNPRELPSRYESQHFLTIESSRAPPLCIN